MINTRSLNYIPVLLLALFALFSCTSGPTLELRKGTRIALVGNNLGSRMMEFGGLETELHLRYPDSTLFIRNLSDPETPQVFDLAQAPTIPGHFLELNNFRTNTLPILGRKDF